MMGLALAAACSENPTAAAPGHISLLLTDAPGDFAHAVVTIDSISLQGSGGQHVLLDTAVTTDLLTLANTTADLVKDAVVPAGTYSQLRFFISGGYIEVENADGSTSIYASSPTYAGLPAGATVAGALQMPSYAQSGLKVNLPGGSVALDANAKILLVDFNVAQSFGQLAGGSGQWVMTPVLAATNFTATGTVTTSVTQADTVTLPSINAKALTLASFNAVLTSASGARSVVALTDSNGDGTYEAALPFVVPGTYQLSLEPPSDSVQITTDPAQPVTVTVSSGQSAAQAFVVTSAHK